MEKGASLAKARGSLQQTTLGLIPPSPGHFPHLKIAPLSSSP